MKQPSDQLADFIFSENSPPSLAEYTALRDSVGWPLFDFEKSGTFLENIDYSVTVRHKASNQLVAFGSLRFPRHYFDFYDLVTDPAYQRRGIGERIVMRVIAWCQNEVNKQSEPWMKVLGKVAQGRNSFYEKFGFVTGISDGKRNEMSLKLYKEEKDGAPSKHGCSSRPR